MTRTILNPGFGVLDLWNKETGTMENESGTVRLELVDEEGDQNRNE